MIELPEAITFARQLNATLSGKQIAAAVRGNSPHKFAFYTRTAEEYADILAGKRIGAASHHGSLILLPTLPEHLLLLGYGGERILFHLTAETLPKKHQLLLQFTDGSFLSVTVQGWGFCQLLQASEVSSHPHLSKPGPDPLSKAFTLEYFQTLFETLKEFDPRSVKFFMISEPAVLGIGNGCLQDILFRAKIDPRRKANALSALERQALYQAIRETLQLAVDQGGRNSERDLFNQSGGYRRLLDSDTVGQPCPACGSPIQKISFQGGAAYLCPTCQK
jgi:formamidopyrimidine-DNA glycosylase